MKERILFAPGANSTELLRSLARKGINTFCLRVMNGVQLAQLALMRSGIAADYALLSIHDMCIFFDEFVPLEAEIEAPKKKIYDTLRSLRLLITENEAQTIRQKLPQGTFKEKNQRLLALYESYMNFCDHPCDKPGSWIDLFVEGVDHVRYRDEISVMRLAMEKAEPVKAQIITLEEFPLSPLEQHLAEKLAGEGLCKCAMAELFEREPHSADIASITAAYGSSNEVEDIIGRIYAEKLPLDCCTVAVANESAYSQLFYEYAVRYDIPITFGCGIPIANSNPAKLLRLHYEWKNHGCAGVDALRSMIMSDAFDRERLMEIFRRKHPDFDDLNGVIELAGALKLGQEPDDEGVQVWQDTEQKLARYRQSLAVRTDIEDIAKHRAIIDCAGELAMHLPANSSIFAQTFSLMRHGLPGRVDRAALNTIGRLMILHTAGGRRLDEASLQAIMNSRVCHEISCEGHLHITGISGALSSIRDHLFIAGMSGANFPGKPVENYLLLDDDYLLFGDEHSVPTSYNTVQLNRKTFFDLTDIAGALGIPVHISYSDTDLASLKEDIPSSVLHELPDTADGIDNKVRRVGFFDHMISGLSAVGAEYLDGNIIPLPEEQEHTPPENINTERCFSPTDIEKYIICPRRFYLNVILGLKEPESDDATEVISAAQLGSLIHELMEYYCNGLPDYDEFIRRAEMMFDDHLAKHYPFNKADIPAARREFIDIAGKAYTNDPGGKVYAAELDVEMKHPSGLWLKGRTDRVELNSDGDMLIVDYKTSHQLRHIENDTESCIQTLLYAAMLEHNGMKVKRCEYRYLRLNKTVSCEYSDSVREQLDRRLNNLRDALISGKFTASAGKPGTDEVCRYCPVKNLCIKGVI